MRTTRGLKLGACVGILWVLLISIAVAAQNAPIRIDITNTGVTLGADCEFRSDIDGQPADQGKAYLICRGSVTNNTGASVRLYREDFRFIGQFSNEYQPDVDKMGQEHQRLARSESEPPDYPNYNTQTWNAYTVESSGTRSILLVFVIPVNDQPRAFRLVHSGIAPVTIPLAAQTTPTSTHTPSSTPTPTSTATPTLVPTPMIAPTLNAVPQPPLTGAPPTEDQLSQLDATLVNGDLQVNITRAYTRSRIGQFSPPANYRYIVFQTTIWNYSNSEQPVFDVSFPIQIGEARYMPDARLMGPHKDELQAQDPGRTWDYPNRDLPAWSRLNVPAQGYKYMLLVYELPTDAHFLTLHMTIGPIEKSMSLALFEQDEQPEEFAIVVEALGGENAWRVLDSTPGEPVVVRTDRRNEDPIRNCDVSSAAITVDKYELESSYEYELEEISDLTVNPTFELNIGKLGIMIKGIPILAESINLRASLFEYRTRSEFRERLMSSRTVGIGQFTLNPGDQLSVTTTTETIETTVTYRVWIAGNTYEYDETVPGTRTTTDVSQGPCS